MRDGEIINNLSNLKKRVAVTYKQMVFCNTRMQAFETVLKGSVWSRLLFLTWPASFLATVDKVHLKLLNEHDEVLRQTTKEAARPRIQIVPAGVVNGR